MSPRRAHRRPRRRSSARPVVLLVAAVIVVALVVGGLTQVSRQSGGYDSNSNRTLASLGVGRGRSVQRQRSRGAHARGAPAEPEPPGAPGEPRQRRASDVRRVVPGRPGRRRRVAAVARRPVRRGLRRTSPGDGGVAHRPRRLPRAAHEPARRQPGRAGDHRRVVIAHRVGHPGERPDRRGGRAAPPRRRAVRARCAVRSLQHRGTAGLPASLWISDPQDWQAGHGGRHGRPHGDVEHAGRHPQPRVAHRAADPARPAHPAGHRRRRRW